jgi:hypothetical protein
MSRKKSKHEGQQPQQASEPSPIEVNSKNETNAHEASEKISEQSVTREWLKKLCEPMTVVTLLLFGATVALYSATRNLVQDASDTAKRQLRAYVGITIKDIQCGTCDLQSVPPLEVGMQVKDVVIFNVKNYGLTPARNVNARVNQLPKLWPQYLPDDFTFADLPIPPVFDQPVTRYLIYPQQEIAATWPASRNNMIAAQNKKAILFFYGHVDYADAFGAEHHTLFCMLWQPWESVDSGRRFPPCDRHNEERDGP